MAFNGIPATVLQKNNEQFFCDPCGNYGNTLYIPCGVTAASVGTPFWAVPVTNDYVQGFRYDGGADAPTADSIAVFKLTSLLNGDFWWVVGTAEDYFAACCSDCDVSPAPTMVTTVGDIAATQYACTDDGTNYDAFFAISDLAGGYRFVSTVSVDGTALTPKQTYSTGSTSKANLVTYLNTNYSSAGTWSNPAGNTIRLRRTTAAWIGFIACQKNA